jgi:hypothetical protein
MTTGGGSSVPVHSAPSPVTITTLGHAHGSVSAPFQMCGVGVGGASSGSPAKAIVGLASETSEASETSSSMSGVVWWAGFVAII